MLRHLILLASICAFIVSAVSYYSAVRLTRDPEATEHIVSWGGSASRTSFTDDTLRFRTRMRWGSLIGVLLYGVWAFLGT